MSSSTPQRCASCFVPGCRSGYYTQRKLNREQGVRNPSLFTVPKDPDIARAWARRIKRADRDIRPGIDSVCERHFHKDFICSSYGCDARNPDNPQLPSYLLERERRRLKPGAYPTVFPDASSCMTSRISTRKSPKKRLRKSPKKNQPAADEPSASSNEDYPTRKRQLKKNAVPDVNLPVVPKKGSAERRRLEMESAQYLSRSDPAEVPVNGSSSKKLRPSRQGKKRKRGKMVKDELEGDLVTSAEPIKETHCISISTQVDFDYPNPQFTFICDRSDSVTVGVQCNLPPSATISNADQCRGFHSYQTVKGNDEGLNVLCGVNWVTFEFLKDRLHSKMSFVLDNASVLLLFLMKLRLGLPFAALGILFGIHRGMAKDVFLAVLGKLCSATAGYWPPMLEVKSELPPFFQGKYAATRLIVGCVEVKAQRLDKLEHRIPMYSTRGEQYAFKILIGVTPTGLISQKSKVYCGRTSEAFIARDSRLLDLLEPGDVILTDSRFPADIDERICPIPPPPDDDCCTPEELKLDEVRLHVEMCLERVKQFKILHFMPRSLFVNIDAILHLCCLLVNHMPPIFEIRGDDFYLTENEEF